MATNNDDIINALKVLRDAGIGPQTDLLQTSTDPDKDMQNILDHWSTALNKRTSDIIRERIMSSGSDFHCNHNIAEFIEEEEYEELIDEVTLNMERVLRSLIIDIDNDHNTQDTARRVAKMYINETFGGRFCPKPKVTAFPNHLKYDTLYVTGPMDIKSTCAHHFQNIVGKCWIGVAPGANVIGLSKFNRIVNWIAQRPTIQEELTIQIADAVEEETEADGIAVILKAEHMCMTHRGVRAHESDMTTSVMRGSLRESPELRNEFYTLLSGMKGWVR